MPAKRKATSKAAAASPDVAKPAKEKAAKVMYASLEKMAAKVTPQRIHLALHERRAHTPSTLARRAGLRHAMDLCKSAQVADPPDGWAIDDTMPDEGNKNDTGWMAGPRPTSAEVRKFSGKPCGINTELFPDLTKASSALDFMETQITRENKIEIMNLTANAMDNYFLLEKVRGVTVTSKYKTALDPDSLRDNPDAFDCWLAARLLIGQYSMSVPQKELWNPKGAHCHAKLVGCMRWDQYRCINKFLILSDVDGKLLSVAEAKAIVAAEKEKAAAEAGEQGSGSGASSSTGGGGACFAFDVCSVNAYTLKRSLVPALTKLQFIDEYTTHVLTTMTLRVYNTKYSAQKGELPTALRGSAHSLVCPQMTVVQAWEKAPGVAKRKRKVEDKHIHPRGRCKHCTTVGTAVTKHKTMWTIWRCDHADCACWVHPDCFFELSQHQ